LRRPAGLRIGPDIAVEPERNLLFFCTGFQRMLMSLGAEAIYVPYLGY